MNREANEINRSLSDLGSTTAVLRLTSILLDQAPIEKLLPEILRLLLLESGANRVLFLKEHKGDWIILSEPPGTFENPYEMQMEVLSMPIINYVLRTSTKVIINDVGVEGMFTNDVYLIVNKVKAVICFPLIYAKRISGVIYFENTTSNSIFNVEKIFILESLCIPIAESLQAMG